MSSYVFKIATQEPGALLTALRESFGANSRVAKQVEEQMGPVIDEPTEFGSIVQARWIEAPDYTEPLPWIYTPWQGEHRWRSADGLAVLWSNLRDVEVLRVGVGDDGLREAAARVVDVLDASPATAALVTARYPGLDHAIDLVRRHLPQSDDGAAAPPADPHAKPAATGGEQAAERAAPSAAPSSVTGDESFTEGFDVACNEILKDLTRLRDEAITGERTDAYEKAIARVEHQREWK